MRFVVMSPNGVSTGRGTFPIGSEIPEGVLIESQVTALLAKGVIREVEPSSPYLDAEPCDEDEEDLEEFVEEDYEE